MQSEYNMKRLWTKEETIIAFNLYCKIPFAKSSKSHPMVREYAKIIERTPDALNMKIGNIGRLDPSLKQNGIKGLSHGAKLEKEVWDDFYSDPEKLTLEGETLLEKFSKNKVRENLIYGEKTKEEETEHLTIVKQRKGQVFFRKMVLSAYDYRCCISGIRSIDLLEACHIISWSESPNLRSNPSNGLCLNSLFHQAYDTYLISITPEMEIVISEKLIQESPDGKLREYLRELNKKKILLPNKFYPSKEFLAIHHEQYLKAI